MEGLVLHCFQAGDLQEGVVKVVVSDVKLIASKKVEKGEENRIE
jgi:hypothetical protein